MYHKALIRALALLLVRAKALQVVQYERKRCTEMANVQYEKQNMVTSEIKINVSQSANSSAMRRNGECTVRKIKYDGDINIIISGISKLVVNYYFRVSIICRVYPLSFHRNQSKRV